MSIIQEKLDISEEISSLFVEFLNDQKNLGLEASSNFTLAQLEEVTRTFHALAKLGESGFYDQEEKYSRKLWNIISSIIPQEIKQGLLPIKANRIPEAQTINGPLIVAPKEGFDVFISLSKDGVK